MTLVNKHRGYKRMHAYITLPRRSSIFLISRDTLTPSAPAISSCFVCGSEEKVSHRFPSMIAYSSPPRTALTFIGVYADRHERMSRPTSEGSCLRMNISTCSM